MSETLFVSSFSPLRRWLAAMNGLLLLLLLLTVGFVFAPPTSAGQTVHIGVLAPRGDLVARQNWQPTLDALQARIPDTRFQLHPLNLSNMAEAVQQQKLDFIITNPGQAVQLGRQFELSWIATLNRPETGSHGIGSALVVRDNSRYQTPQDLYGQPVAAISPQAFGGYLTLHYQLLQQELDPEHFFADVRFLGYPVDASLYQLRDQVVEAAVVPVCLLESMSADGLLDRTAFRVIGAETPAAPCRISTAQYPNWSIARTAHGSAPLAKQIARALLALPAEHPALQPLAASGWSTPVSHLAVDQLYETLQLHPLMRPFWQQLVRWLKAHRDWVIIAGVMLALMALYHFWLQIRFNRSQTRLTRTLNELADKQSQLEHAQRIAVVGELGASLAHEISQPLSAIRNFSESARRRLSRQAAPERIMPVLDQMFAQLDRTDAIIQRLRKLIKQPVMEYRTCDLKALIEDCCNLMAYPMLQQAVHCELESDADHCWLDVDRVGLQQVFVNLLGNAMDACAEYRRQHPGQDYQARVRVQIQQQAQSVRVSITDNGTGLMLQGYPKAFMTTKAEGLGLGWVISRDITERHGGTLRITDTGSHGCRVDLELPHRSGTSDQTTDRKQEESHATGR